MRREGAASAGSFIVSKNVSKASFGCFSVCSISWRNCLASRSASRTTLFISSCISVRACRCAAMVRAEAARASAASNAVVSSLILRCFGERAARAFGVWRDARKNC